MFTRREVFLKFDSKFSNLVPENGCKNSITLLFLLETNYLLEAPKFFQYEEIGKKNPEMEKWGKKDDQGLLYVFHYSFFPPHL